MAVLKKLHEFLQVVRAPGGIRALLGSRPRSMTSFRIVQSLASEGVDFLTVIDGGANVGQFARAASRAFRQAVIYSIEPLPDIAHILRQNLSDVPGHRIFRTALGSSDGEIEFRRTSYSQSSSILQVGKHTLPAMQGIREVETLRVPLTRLDTLLSQVEMPSPVLLKLDLQGYELEALKGAVSVLAKCDFVLLEAAFEEMYEGEPMFDEVLGYMREQGFLFKRPLHVAEDVHGRILQIDALFQKSAKSTGG
jgi:FkbM family methyltransferase